MRILKMDDGKNFLRIYRANKEQVDISDANLWLAAVIDGGIVGVVGIKYGMHTDRIKGLFVPPEWRGQGIGTALLKCALRDVHAKRVTAFCTRNSESIFVKQGFRVVRKANAHGISFVEKEMIG